ncbi:MULTISPECIES: O-antigen ligase family protein [unclassified Marinobacter]|uniref:O-antigen ligase family protein n=1 Tax=unclassified Marinobacter TaxID=83889 RepID=UPI0018F1C421|nr:MULTISPECIES: O-antigen ligase family protein [unclassified Marinobacter]
MISSSLVSQKASLFMKGLFTYIPHFCVIVLAITLFSNALIAPADTYNYQRFIQFLLFLTCFVVTLLAFLSLKLDPRLFVFVVSRDRCVAVACLAAITIGLAGSLSLSKFPVWSMLDLEYWLIGLGMTWSTLLSIRQFEIVHWQRLGLVCLLLMTLFFIRSMIDISISVPFTNLLTATPGVANIRLFSDLAVVIMPLSWLALSGRSGPGLRFLVLIMSIYWAWILLLTEARSGLVSLFIAVSWVFLLHGKAGRWAFCIYLFIIATSFALLLSLPVLSVDGWTRDVTSSSGRWSLWALSLKYFAESFPFGIGGMMFAADGRPVISSPHNIILILMAEWGALVVAGILTLLLVSLRQGSLEWRSRVPFYIGVVRTPVVIGTVAGSVNLMFSGAQIAPFSSLVLVLSYGALLAIYFPSRRKEKSGGIFGTVLSIGLLVICFHASWLGYELYEISEANRQVCYEATEVFSPRFWVQGRLDCGVGY